MHIRQPRSSYPSFQSPFLPVHLPLYCMLSPYHPYPSIIKVTLLCLTKTLRFHRQSQINLKVIWYEVSVFMAAPLSDGIFINWPLYCPSSMHSLWLRVSPYTPAPCSQLLFRSPLILVKVKLEGLIEREFRNHRISVHVKDKISDFVYYSDIPRGILGSYPYDVNIREGQI